MQADKRRTGQAAARRLGITLAIQARGTPAFHLSIKPLVSVVIPVFNCQAYIAEAVDSALAQDYPNTEVIVVNDGPTDGNMAELSRIGGRIRLIDQANAGPPQVRNAGLAAEQGHCIAFLDADAVWLLGKLSAQVGHLEAP